jgi:ubiquitin-conjugating enzyme E2 Z
MSSVNIKRIHRDIREYTKSSLREQGIFCVFDDTDITHVRAMIVGPEDTPYAYGYYLFDVHFPANYPFEPPKVAYMTRRGRTRFHPNLYANSKVCLSILNTWIGPGWTSAQTLSSVLLTIQSILTKDPLTNEPGFEVRKTPTEKRHANYETMVTYENYRTAILEMMEKPPPGFEAFIPIMQQCFIVNADNIQKQLLYHHSKEPVSTKMRCGVYAFDLVVDYPSCIALFQMIKQQLVPSTSPYTAPEAVVTDLQPDDLEMIQAELQAITTASSIQPNTHKHTTRIKKPKHKASDVNMQGTTVTVEQGTGLEPIQFQSRKCKQQNHASPEKWQWRRITTKNTTTTQLPLT